MRDPYAVLGVSRAATPDQIKKAYRKLAKQHHPDLNPSDPRSAERFKEVAAAYELLADPRSRASFDRTGATSTRREVHRDAAVSAFLEAFTQQVPLMTALFVEEILPRYIERYYRGLGARLVHQLLDDIERHRLVHLVNGPVPGEQARALAARVARECPVGWRPEHVVDDRGKPVLGRMLQGLAVGSRGLGWRSRIELFAGSFHAAGHREPETLGAAILPVIATEYVRYLELWLPQELRPVVAREGAAGGWGGRRLTLAQASRADALYLARRYGSVAAIGLVILLLIWAVLTL